VTEVPPSSDTCYRHPDRQSYVLCQRCGRTICPECQTQAAVGVHCPECVAEARQRAPKRKPAIVTAFSRSSSRPVVTYSLMAICAIVFALQFITADVVTQWLAYIPVYTAVQPWRMVTAIFLHGSILHLLFNMYALFIFGPMLESMLGRIRFLALYLIAGFAGSVAVLVLAPGTAVVGASGAIFGLFSAFFVIQRRLGGNATQLLIIIALNLAIGFFVPNVAWQAHLGGLIVGALIALIFMRTRRTDQQRLQIALVGSTALGLIVITVFAAMRLGLM